MRWFRLHWVSVNYLVHKIEAFRHELAFLVIECVLPPPSPAAPLR